jgi:hypothetical protein
LLFFFFVFLFPFLVFFLPSNQEEKSILKILSEIGWSLGYFLTPSALLLVLSRSNTLSLLYPLWVSSDREISQCNLMIFMRACSPTRSPISLPSPTFKTFSW